MRLGTKIGVILAGVVWLGACGSDTPASPSKFELRSTTDAAAALRLEVAATVRRELNVVEKRLATSVRLAASERAELAARRESLTERLVELSATPPARSLNAEMSLPRISADLDPLNMIARDLSLTYTHLYISDQEVYSQTTLTPDWGIIGAFLTEIVSGTVQETGGISQPFNGYSTSTIPTAGWAKWFSVPRVDCVYKGGTGSALSTHQASATISGQGLVLDTWPTAASDSCTPPPEVVVQLGSASIKMGASTTAIVSNSSTCVPTWSSSNVGVASVSGTFQATVSGLYPGTSTISATCTGMRFGSASITVTLMDGACSDEAADNYTEVGVSLPRFNGRVSDRSYAATCNCIS